MKKPFRIEKNGAFWDLVMATNQTEALSLSISGEVNKLPEDFARHFKNNKLTAWINSNTYQVQPA